MSTHNSSTSPADGGGSTAVSTATSEPLKDEKTLYPMRAHALWYHGLGWPVIAVHHPIFMPDGTFSCSCYRGLECPEKSRGKHPVNPGWQKNVRFAREEFEIRGEWRVNPYANIGIPTGEKWGRFILDGDGAEGIASIRELEMKLEPLPRTPLQRTGGGGLQWFFQTSGRAFPNSVSRLAPKVDTRGENGQGVVAPSLHRSGRRYRWLVLPSDAPLATLPDTWVEYIREKVGNERRSYWRRPDLNKLGFHRPASMSLAQAKRLLVQMLDHPVAVWATEHPDDVSREVWRGIATNLAVPALEHIELEDFARKAFHIISEGYSTYSEQETDTIFDGALKSATTHGAVKFVHMKSNGAPNDICVGGSSLIHAARCRLGI